MSTLKIAIVDDHRLVIDGIASILNQVGKYRLFKFEGAQAFMDSFSKDTYDLALLDIDMPYINGIETARWLKNNHPEVKIIALSAMNDEINVIRMFKEGSGAFVTKSFDSYEFKKAIHEVVEHDMYLGNKEARNYVQYTRGHGVSGEKKIALELDEQELNFITLLCEDLRNKEIAEKVHVSVRTIEAWTRKLYEKLGVRSRIGIVQFAYRNKLVTA